MGKRITMLGSANVDFILSVPHLPARGESITGDNLKQTFGGKGSNQAVAARRCGADVNLMVGIGGDSLGQTLLENYKKDGFDVSNLSIHNDVPCGTALIFFDQAGDNMLGYALGANAKVSVEQVNKAEPAIADSAILMMQMEIPDEPMLRAIELAKKHGVRVMLNYAPYRETAVKLKDVDILVANEVEAGGLLGGFKVDGEATAREAVKKLAAANGHDLIIITLGANGSVLMQNGEIIYSPPFKIEAKDATAAGDSYCGALAYALVEKYPLAEAARFASAAGAICASRIGAQPSIPTKKEIDAFLVERK